MPRDVGSAATTKRVLEIRGAFVAERARIAHGADDDDRPSSRTVRWRK